MDLEHSRYATFDELREYCWRVASTVGLICLNIFGCRHPGGRDYAMNLGLALQLTNIVRDVKTDLSRGRIYLPQDETARAPAAPRTALAGPARCTGPVAALLALQCRRARDYYDRAAAALPPGEARHLVAAEIMGAIYFAILQRIERRGYDVFSEVVRVPRPAARLDCRGDLGAHADARAASRRWRRPARRDRRRRRGRRRRLRRPERRRARWPTAGARVLVVEARPVLGGRTFATRDRTTGDWVDNGQHVLLGCYHETLAYLARIGARDRVRVQSSLAVPMVDTAGAGQELRCPALPSPLQLVAGVLAWPALSWRERLSVLRHGARARRRSDATSAESLTVRRVAAAHAARPPRLVRAAVGAARGRGAQSAHRPRQRPARSWRWSAGCSARAPTTRRWCCRRSR